MADKLKSSPPAEPATDVPSNETALPPTPPAVGKESADVKELTSKDYYFDSYAHFGIHEEMLKDEVRTMSYRAAIMKNRHLFKDKVVLDVGCGTGVLSMFAAQAGAKMVYSVDMSGIIEQAKKIVKANGFSDRITLLRGKMEEIVLPVDKVDIIISEWMGYFLLYESMLDTVIYARDKYLREGGIILPDRAVLKVCAIEDEDYRKEKIDFWDNVYGFDMSCIREIALLEPLVDTVDGEAVISNSCDVITIDIMTCKVSDLSFIRPFQLVFNTDEISCHALVAYFDIFFDAGLDSKVKFSTSPDAEYTHWKQTVFYLHDIVKVNCGETVAGTIKSAPNAKNPRDLDIDITYDFKCSSKSPSGAQSYRLR